MVRTVVLAFGLILGISACQTDRGGGSSGNEEGVSRTSLSSQTAGDNRVAKEVFGHIPEPTEGAHDPIGSYAKGCQSGAVQLPETGPTWQAMRLSRNRNWGQPELVSFVQDLSAYAATRPGWSGLYVGDMSQPRGGPMLTGHASHQIGLDADIWALPATRLNLTRQEREDLSSIRMDRQSGAYATDAMTTQHMEIIKRAAQDPRVARIFLFPGGKVALCNWATGDRSWLNKVRPWFGHNYHFHVRLNCPRGATYCVDQAPPPAGDGCADAQVWVNNILNPPPPDPNPPPPSGPLRMAQLPGQCGAVAAAN